MEQHPKLLPHVRLMFNVKNPTPEDCWTDGYQCAQRELDEDSNPYQEDTLEYRQWTDGWWSGFYNEEPLYDMSGVDELAGVEKPALAQVSMLNAAANESFMGNAQFQLWMYRALKAAGVVAASGAIGYQLLEMAA